MSKEEKKAPVKALAKAPKAIKTIKPLAKHVPAKRLPAKHVPAQLVLTTFDDLMEDFRSNFIENIGSPWEWVNVDSVYPIREATADLVDAGSKFVVHAEMPGVPKDKIDITLTKDGIEISAETDVETEEKEQNYVVRERAYSNVYKQLSFPEEVIPEQAISTLKDGLLEVSIPKKKPAPALKKHKVVVK
jgi:HSP20 family protein